MAPFEGLSSRLQSVFSKLRGKGKLTEDDVNEALREVRLALLEADVNFKVVKDFIGRVREQAVGQVLEKGFNPAMTVVNIVNKELTDLMGGTNAKLAKSNRPPTVIMMVGLQGAGKTTTTGKLAKLLLQQNHRPLLVAADIYRPAAIKQLQVLGEQVKVLLEAAIGERFAAIYVLAIHTGLRQGELLGLKWEDVDLENGLIRVRRTLTRYKGRVLLSEPKTKRSRRTVRLTETAVDALREHLARQMTQMEALGDLYRDQGLVFATQKGTLVNPSNLRKRSFAPLLEKAGLPSIRFHDLRHTCATLLLASNVNPKIVSEMLGHASIAITLDTYSHVLPTMQGGATRALEDMLR